MGLTPNRRVSVISDAKIELLQAICGNPTGPEVEAASIAWKRQMEILYPEAQRFHGWRDAAYDPNHGQAADRAVAARAKSGAWPTVAPGVGRLLYARLVQAIAVIGANEAADAAGGTVMPDGLSDDQLAGAIIAFWTYDMELPLAERPGRQHGTA